MIDGREFVRLNPDKIIDGREFVRLNPDKIIDGRELMRLNPDKIIDGRELMRQYCKSKGIKYDASKFVLLIEKK